ncbi:hypothetical protein [Streptomyces sp. YIM 98790]|uniref:hypothetical protein n=1 Tax=Streptomyces sp. YIM 98790 TaxID=2689077 RepID=UPI001407ECA2|nr:hypothetical protein [Streptomyces sp. YIM 98790]
MPRRPVGDDGAAFALYIWMVSGLLLVALTFFVFAQAAVTRSAGQSAADAAALAAVREARDGLYDDFLGMLDGDDLDDLQDILDGRDFASDRACQAAAAMAARNKANLVDCDPVTARQGYRVVVETQETVGESVIPGTETQTATAEATAVLGGLCAGGRQDGGGTEGGETEGTGEDDGPAEEAPVRLACDDRDWEFDLQDEAALPAARDLFRIYLED